MNLRSLEALARSDNPVDSRSRAKPIKRWLRWGSRYGICRLLVNHFNSIVTSARCGIPSSPPIKPLNAPRITCDESGKPRRIIALPIKVKVSSIG